MSNKWFVVFKVILFIGGMALGYALSLFTEVKIHKVIFVIGSIYNLLAVIVLSELFMTLRNHKEISLNYIAPAILWIQTVLPLGSMIGAKIAKIAFAFPGASRASTFSLAVFAYSLIPLFLFDSLVVFPRMKKFRDLETSGAIATTCLPLLVDRKEDLEQSHTHQEYGHVNWAVMRSMVETRSTADDATNYSGPVTGLAGGPSTVFPFQLA